MNFSDGVILEVILLESRSKLSHLGHRVDLAHGSQIDITIECDSPVTKFMPTRVYRSIYQCVVSGSNIGDIWVQSMTPKEDTVAHFASSEVTSRGPRGVYKVPSGCPSKRYRTPCGLGSTLLSNNVVLMHPDVPQYLVEKE